MALFSSVPVVDVHRENFKLLWPSLVLAIRTSSYVAIDAELSGLGNRKNLLTRSMEDRYQSLAQVAKTRSVLSLGISCFKSRTQSVGNQSTPENKNPALHYLVQTFNITTLCSEDYVVEPGSLKFLVDHGFDFNKQYASGLPYHRGVDKGEKEDTQTLRALFSELIESAKPVIFHNGLVDLVFLYQNFYTTLPSSSAQFIADLCEMFPGGIFDTKYLAEFETPMQASYLEYVFRKSQRENAQRASCNKQQVTLEFCQYDEGLPYVGYHQCSLPASFTSGGVEKTEKETNRNLCETYASHGHCKNGIRCFKSHDPDAIQDADDDREERRQRKRKRKRQKHPKAETEDGSPDRTGNIRDNTGGGPGGSKMQEEGGLGDVKEDEMDVNTKDDAIQDGQSLNKTEKHSDIGVGKESTNGGKNDAGQGTLSSSCSKNLTTHTGGHRAGYDAFMTGFAMATLASQLFRQGSKSKPPEIDKHPPEFVEAFRLGEFKNKLFLSAKPVPLVIVKSGFAKTSQNHRDKMRRLGITQS